MLLRTVRIATFGLLLRPYSLQRRAMSSFKLDKTIFSPSLYKQVQDIWFEGHPIDAQDIDMSVAKRWFMLTADERDAFDSKCRSNFAHALEAIGPEKLAEPTAEPFINDLREKVQESPSDDARAEAAWTALSMILLLDQMTRNIYRSNEGLRKVYNHYDKIAYSLATTLISTKSPIGRPDLHPQLRQSIAHRQWFYMPLMHSEDLDAHKKVYEILTQLMKEQEEDNAPSGMKTFLEQGIKSEEEHKELIERFGRYPHRNGALGRDSTPEEKEYLSKGGATFGVAQDDE